MPDENIKTTLQFNADISEFSSAMQEANRAIKLANSEFKAASSGMDDWAGSADGLTAKLQQLANVQAAEERKLEILKNAYAQVAAEQGENSKAAQELQIKINNQQAAVNKAGKEYQDYAKRLEEVERGADDAGDALEDAGDAAKDAGKEAEDSADGWSIMGQVIADLATDAISSFIDAIASAAEETREYRREMAKMEGNAKDAGHKMEDVKDILEDVAGTTGDTEAAMEGLNMLMASGFDTRDLEKASKALSGAAAKFSGLKFEAIAEGIQETLAVGKGVGPFAELIERTGANLEDFDEGLQKCTTAAEKQQYVMDWLSKSGLADVHDAYVQNNADLVEAEKAQFRHNEAMAQLGAAIEPAQTAFTNLKASLLEAVAPAIEKVVNLFMDNWPAIEPIVSGLAAAMAVLAAKLAIVGILKALLLAFAALNTTMAANPAMLVAMAIAGLTGYLISASRQITDTTSNLKKAISAITSFGDAVDAATPSIMDVNSMLSKYGKTLDEINKTISDTENAVTEILKTALSENRRLRQEELKSIEEYNLKIKELEAEKLDMYRQTMIVEMVQLTQEANTLTQEQAAQYAKNMQAANAEALKVSQENYDSRIAQIYNFHATQGTLNTEAYQRDIDAAKAAHDAEIKETNKYYGDSMELLVKHSAEWVKGEESKWKRTNEAATRGKNFYAAELSEMELDNTNAWFNIVGAAIKGGAEVSKETKKTASMMLANFENLPDDCEEIGHETLMGIVGGLEDEIPALKNASEMTAQEIVDVLKRELEINSPSRVTKRMGGYVVEGLGRGMTEKENWLQNTVGGFVGRTLNWFKDALGIHSPSKETEWMGEMFTAGLVKGIENGRRDVQSAIEGLTASSLDGASIGLNGQGGAGAVAGKSIVFYQNNYSPKALTRREIYRQTHNALAYAGGAK